MNRSYEVRDDRERVLEAMVRSAAAKGYEATTVEEVAAAAGVSRAAFDEMFGSIAECFLAAHAAMIDVLFARLSSAYREAAEPWSARVMAALEELLDLLASEWEIVRMGMLEVGAAGDEARVRYRRALERFLPFLDEGRTALPGGENLPEDTARLAIGSATSMIFDEVRAGRGPELPGLLPQLGFVVLMPYLGVEGAEEAMRRASGS